MKLKYIKEAKNEQGIPRWIVKTETGITMASTRTRDEARSFIRKAQEKPQENVT